tara:strand:- start:47 stop:2683 length:2637 start_codon:yes stop_codon:yes gene_type:complete
MIKQLVIAHVLFVLLFVNSASAQCDLNVVVADQNGDVLYGASVLVLDAESEGLVSFAATSVDGKLKLSIAQNSSVKLKINHFGYRDTVFAFSCNNETSTDTLFIHLEVEVTSLDEVLVHGFKGYVVKGDTVIFNASEYANGNERDMEDLLKKIPGVNVDKEGVVKVGDQEISSLMVDGQDFFNSSYQKISRSMPANPIKEIQVIQKYSKEDMLKGFKETDDIAINVVLADSAKNIWFGEVEAGGAINKYHDVEGVVMRFAKNVKSVSSSKTNNLPTHTVHSPYGELFSSAGNSKLLGLANFDWFTNTAKNPGMFSSRGVFSSVKEINNNGVVKVNDKSKFEYGVAYNNSNRGVDVVETERIFLLDSVVQNQINRSALYSHSTALGKTKYTHRKNNKTKLELYANYLVHEVGGEGDMSLNTVAQESGYSQTNYNLNPGLKIYYKPSKVLLFSSEMSSVFLKSEGLLHSNHPFLNLTPDSTLIFNSANQRVSNRGSLSYTESSLRVNHSEKLAGRVGVNANWKSLNVTSLISLLDNNTVALNTGLNEDRLQTTDVSGFVEVLYRTKNFMVEPKLGVHKLVQNSKVFEQDIKYYLNPGLTLKRKWNKSSVAMIYSYRMDPGLVNQIYHAPIITGLRSTENGLGSFQLLDNSILYVTYKRGGFLDKVMYNANLIATYNKNYISTDLQTNGSSFNSKNLLRHNRYSLNFSNGLDVFIEKLKTNIKFKLSHFRLNYSNVLNQSDDINITNGNTRFGLAGSSAFGGPFEFVAGGEIQHHYISGLAYSSNHNIESYITLRYNLNKLSFEVTSENYFMSTGDQYSPFTFVDFSVRYKKSKRFSVELNGTNLLNQDNVYMRFVSDFSLYEVQNSLYPRIIILSAKYSF